jgi:hypothetical protein
MGAFVECNFLHAWFNLRAKNKTLIHVLIMNTHVGRTKCVLWMHSIHTKTHTSKPPKHTSLQKPPM